MEDLGSRQRPFARRRDSSLRSERHHLRDAPLLESFLVDDRQGFTDSADLVGGQRIADACMGWDMTVPVLRELAAAVRARRARLSDTEPGVPAVRSVPITG